MSLAFVLTAVNGGSVHVLSFMNLTTGSAFEQIGISSFQVTTDVSITVPQINYKKVIRLDSSNDFRYSHNFMQDISVPLNVCHFIVTLRQQI